MGRPIAEAHAVITEFRAHFPRITFNCWEIAGSVRRGKPEVKDIEHVIIPAHGAAGMFGDATEQLFWAQLDRLVAAGTMAKAIYDCKRADGTEYQQHRWGDTYRGVSFGGFTHELFLAKPENWGVIYGIRTGSAAFSQHVVTRILDGGEYRVQGGYLTRQPSGERVPCCTEQDWFTAAGMQYIEPAAREIR